MLLCRVHPPLPRTSLQFHETPTSEPDCAQRIAHGMVSHQQLVNRSIVFDVYGQKCFSATHGFGVCDEEVLIAERRRTCRLGAEQRCKLRDISALIWGGEIWKRERSLGSRRAEFFEGFGHDEKIFGTFEVVLVVGLADELF